MTMYDAAVKDILRMNNQMAASARHLGTLCNTDDTYVLKEQPNCPIFFRLGLSIIDDLGP